MGDTFFDRYLKAWNDHDIDSILEFFTEDGVYEDVAAARINRGKAEIRTFIEETFTVFPDFHLANDATPVGGPDGRFGLEWTMTGTHKGPLGPLPATNKSFSIRGASSGEIEDEKIKRNSDYWNLADFLVQIGILPPLPTE